MSNAAGGTYWSGTRGTGALTNALVNANGGKKSSATVKVSADTSAVEESMEDALNDIKERIDDIINDLEHEIFLLQRNGGGLDEILARYKKIQEQANSYADQYRAKGLDENSEYIQDL